jgi:radical SAM superfamily enzyme YgiQ (UPF0313 family)
MQRKIKFLFICPTSEYWRTSKELKPKNSTKVFRYSMLTGLCVAASAPNYVETIICDEDIEPIDFDTDAEVIGITFMTFNAPRAYEIADYFRNEKGKTVIFGGYHPTFMPEEAIQHSDAVCIGESEEILSKIFDDYLDGNLKKFYKNDNLINLGKLPKVDRTLLKRGSYIHCDTVQATRGCPYQCKFCSITSFFNHQYRKRPIDDVIEELSNLGNFVLFMDDNMISDIDYTEELLSKMIPLKKKWFSQCSISIANSPKLLKLASKSGCTGLFIGLESIEQGNLQKWNKNFYRANDYQDAIKRLHSAGIAICAGIVFGDDSDHKHTFSKTLQFLFDARVDALQATIMTPFPGTPLYAELENNHRIIDYNWQNYDFSHVVFEPKNMSVTTLKNGHDWVLSEYYSVSSLTKRFLNQLQYLTPLMLIKASVPVNLSYRARLKANKTINPELTFDNL